MEPSITAFGSVMRPITLISDTVLPEPDSPTTPTISWLSMRNEIVSTAKSRPRSVRKRTRRSRTSSSGPSNWGTSTSVEADAGIEGCVGDVDKGVGEDDEEGGVHHGRHDDRQVEVAQRVIGELAHTLQAEYD